MLKRMPDSEYFKLDAVSNSYLSRLEKCPAAALIEVEQTPSMTLGSATHCLALEGSDAFHERFAVLPEMDRRTKEGKAAYTAFCEANEGKQVITFDQIKAIQGMAESIMSHPTARELLASGEPETAVTWETDGVFCKGKVDWLGTHLIDLKTCQDSSPQVFTRTIFNSGYYRQGAFYLEGLRKNFVHPDGVIFIAVSNTPPYAVAVYQLDDESLEHGEASYRYLLRKHKECLASKQFPAYQEAGIVEVRPPAWMSE